jgi:hypothetical protein
MMIEILLTQGQVALIDDEDYNLVSNYNWYANKDGRTFYAATKIRQKGKRTTISMHRIIMGAKIGQQIDHTNGNGCDNRKENLRFCTNSQNQQNRHNQLRGTSNYKG